MLARSGLVYRHTDKVTGWQIAYVVFRHRYDVHDVTDMFIILKYYIRSSPYIVT
jgi:hypothetical protein